MLQTLAISQNMYHVWKTCQGEAILTLIAKNAKDWGCFLWLLQKNSYRIILLQVHSLEVCPRALIKALFAICYNLALSVFKKICSDWFYNSLNRILWSFLLKHKVFRSKVKIPNSQKSLFHLHFKTMCSCKLSIAMATWLIISDCHPKMYNWHISSFQIHSSIFILIRFTCILFWSDPAVSI